MQASVFYTQVQDKAIPLHCIAVSVWQDKAYELTDTIKNLLELRQFTGKLGDVCVVHKSDGSIDSVYVGTGDSDRGNALAQAAFVLPPATYKLCESISSNEAQNWALAQYQFTKYKKQALSPRVLVLDANLMQPVLTMVEAIFLVRDLINTPANDMGPKELAQALQQLATTYDAEYQEWVGPMLLQANFPAIHAVGRASAVAPRLVALTWGDRKHKAVTLVGKGVCFDSGGLDIKPAAAMRYMKKDMGGAAHVLGLAQWIMANNLPIHLQVLIPAVENAVGADAFRPGDVLTMRNGLTVEIDNTDAEGRLVLADALVKACEAEPELLIDFATLTGAARVAVGTDIAAMFSNQNALAEKICHSGERVADFVWRLPLFAPYAELLNSSVADLANASASPYAGAIIAGLFLQNFVKPGIPWVHFDIMAWNVVAKPGKPEGGEALGLRAVADYLLLSLQA
jgi:leucyl aminopeptidase